MFNWRISMKFFLEIHQVAINPNSLCFDSRSSKLSQKNPLKKNFNFIRLNLFRDFFWDNFELRESKHNEFRLIATWWISKKNFIEIRQLNIYFVLIWKYFLVNKFIFWLGFLAKVKKFSDNSGKCSRTFPILWIVQVVKKMSGSAHIHRSSKKWTRRGTTKTYHWFRKTLT